MTTPDTNYFTTYSGSWHNSLRFKYHSTDSNGDYVCAAYDNNDNINDGTGNKIKFNPTTGVWSDVDTSAPPVQFTSSSTWANTTSVSGYPNKLWIWNGSTNLNLEMDTPSWARSGGGTSTEGVAVPSGTITRNGDVLTFTVEKSSPLSSSIAPTVHYQIFKDGAFVRAINHTNNTVDATSVESNAADGVWKLFYNADTIVQVLASYTVGNKKVFCNFW